MKYSIDLTCESSNEWVQTVMDDFKSFLQDHANCERKASAMAMSFVAKYPDRTEIIPELIKTAIEELDHFKMVYEIMEERNIVLPHEIGEDYYVKQLLKACRDGREARFLDRLLLASIIECRGAERFKKICDALQDPALKNFYKQLWTSEAKHGNIFVRMAVNYFEESEIYSRLQELNEVEGKVLKSLPLKPALH